jgi:hypothetical protein
MSILLIMKGEKMRPYTISFIAIISIGALYLFSFATPPNPRWTQMPDSIQSITNTAELEPFLSSESTMYRQWAVERLGEIGTDEDIPRLLDIFYNEPYDTFFALDRSKDVKDEALLAIGEIGGAEAESALFSLFDQLDIHNIRLPDSLDIIEYLCLALGRLSSANAIPYLQKIYQDTTLGWGLRSDALRGIYLQDLSNSQYATAADTVYFLLTRLENHFSADMQDYEAFIISEAIRSAFLEINSSSILNALQAKSIEYEDKPQLNDYLKNIERVMTIKLN